MLQTGTGERVGPVVRDAGDPALHGRDQAESARPCASRRRAAMCVTADAPAREDSARRSDSQSTGIGLSELECNLAGQIATAVWLGKLSDGQAREALLSYAIARHLCDGVLVIRLRASLESEYRHWRERQDLAS